MTCGIFKYSEDCHLCMSEDTAKETMKDVSHTPPTGEGAARVWERGPAAQTAADGGRASTEADVDEEE